MSRKSKRQRTGSSSALATTSQSVATQETQAGGHKILNASNMWWAMDQDNPRSDVLSDPSKYLNALENNALIFAAVDRIAVDSLEAPLILTRGKGLDKQRIDEHPILDLLDDINPYSMNGSDWRLAQMYCLLTRGEAFNEIVMNKAGTQPAAMYWIHNDAISPEPDPRTFIKNFKVKLQDNKTEYLDPDAVLWIKKFNPNNPYGGLSPLSALRETLKLDRNAQTAQSASFANGGMVAGALSPKGDMSLSETATKKLRDNYRNEMGGAKNAHSLLFLSHGVDFQKMGLSADDQQWLETRKFALWEVANAFKIPVALLSPEFTSYDNLRASKKLLWEECIVPWLRFLCEALNKSLVRKFDPDKRFGLSLEPDFTKVPALMPEYVELEASYNNAILAGRKTINEVRAISGDKPVPWGDGFWGQATMFNLAADVAAQRPVAVTPALGSGEAGKSSVVEATKAAPRTVRVARTREVREELGARHSAAIDRIATELHTATKSAFEKQRDAVLANFPRKKTDLTADAVFVPAGDDLMPAVTKTLEAAALEAYASVRDQIGEDPKSIQGADAKSAGAEFKAVEASFKAPALAPDQTNPRLRNIAALLAKRVLGIDEFTKEQIGTAIEEGLRRGYSIDQIARGFEKENYGGVRGVFTNAIEGDGITASRAERIARTETAFSYSRASTAAFEDAGLSKKEWLLGIGDERGICQELNGEVVGLNDSFSDGSFTPPAHPNCTCTVLPVIESNDN